MLVITEYLKTERVFIVSIRKDLKKKFEFPAPVPLNLRLKDLLEPVVEEKV